MTIRIEEDRHPDGTLWDRSYYCDDLLHREDGPAYELFNKNTTRASCIWYIRGKRHREDGPAHEIFSFDGTLTYCAWYIDNKLHRNDGPAKEHFSSDGRRTGAAYYLNGNRFSKPEYHRQVALSKLAITIAPDCGVFL
jgi:hypothetical protein